MAGASKQRARKERKDGNNGDSSNGKEGGKSSDSPETQQASSSSESPPQRNSPPSGWDGNRDPTSSAAAPSGPTAALQATRNMDLGLRNSYLMYGAAPPTDLAPRPNNKNSSGRVIPVKLNTWHVTTANLKPVHQYDVVIGGGEEKRGLIKRAWEAPTLQKQLGAGWIFDGNKIAYCLSKKDAFNTELDLDREYGKTPRTGKDGKVRENKCRVRIKWTKQVPMQSLDAYLNGNGSWDVNCLEAMTCLDRVMRETPSRRFTSIKRNFYSRGQQRTTIGAGVEAMKGVYITIRPVLAGFGRPACLSVNVDVANTTFWIASPLHIVASQLLGSRDVPTMVSSLRPQGDRPSPFFGMLRRLRRLRVTANYRVKAGAVKTPDEFVIDKILPIRPRDKKFHAHDANGKEYETNVEQYMTTKYSTRLQYPDLPLVKMTKGQDTCVPMELLTVADMQRVASKLNDRQTAEMIKFAVTLPQQRWRDIDNGVTMLEWRSDKYLQNYGLQVGSPAKIDAVLLPPPKVMFAQNSPPAEPKTTGRWDLRGKRFIEPHPAPVKSWGVCVVPGRTPLSKEATQTFIGLFIRTFEGHGGKIVNKQPVMIQGNPRDAAGCVTSIWNAAGDQAKQVPQILFFIVPDKNAEFYASIKKSADCRYGVVSQVLQSAHVSRGQAQYCSNVAMKVNAKLGGATSRAAGIKTSWYTRPTMVIGADVSHGAPGTEAASIAAITVSWDRAALRYAAGVETNGRRVEMITENNWQNTFKGLYGQWVKTVGGGRHPEHIIYMRDGVSEGQYSQVLDQEVASIAKVVHDADAKHKPQFTVLTCTKRHHVRFFPEGQAGDRNGNPQPGTLVEQGVTDPRDFDFYLCAHSAIKGTARPVHYTVLRDDVKLSQVDMQNMIYEASYQYVRSTTPVSLHPAIYYAHLAALRAGSHVKKAEGSGEEMTRTGTSEQSGDVDTLLPMPNQRGIKGTMWFV